jgi:hypothetical protein
VNIFKYDTEKVILDKYSIIEKSQTRTVYNWLQYFSKGSLRKELENARLSKKQQYKDVRGNPYNPDTEENAIVANIG